MPQVAAFADRHYVVSKRLIDARTDTVVTAVETDSQVEELASMLAGSPTPSARDNARELLSRAAEFKRERG
jgi:DNA repair protein RecN (Recombination protein N)